MKKFSLLILLVVVVVMVGGVALGKIGGSEDRVEVRGEVITETKVLPEEIAQIITNLKTQKGYFVFSQPAFETGEDEAYILISSGEKRTGGYEISLEALERDNETLKVVVKEEEPSADEMNIQVLTYPHIIIGLQEEFETYKVVNTEGEAFKNLVEVELDKEEKVEKEEKKEKEVEKELEEIPVTDPTIGESFIEGEIIDFNASERMVEIEVHLDRHTPDVEPRFEIESDAIIRQLENGEKRELAIEDLEEDMIVGMILTPDGKVRAVINHVFEF